MITALVLTVLCAGCTTSRTGLPVGASTTILPTAAPTRTTATPTTTPATTTTTPDAYDAACTVASGDDLPKDTWPERPKLDPRPSTNPNISDCRLDNSLLGHVAQNPGTPGGYDVDVANPKYFIVHVFLLFNTNKTGTGPAPNVTVAGRPGQQTRDQTDTTPLSPRCDVIFRTADPTTGAGCKSSTPGSRNTTCAPWPRPWPSSSPRASDGSSGLRGRI